MNRSGRTKVLGTAAALTLVAVVTGGAALWRTSGDESDQCALPVSQRTGGWACMEPAGGSGERGR